MKILVANWKMNGLFDEFKRYFDNLLSKSIPKDRKIIFCLPYIFLHEASILTKDYLNIKIFSQNCHHEPRGAFTGEISCEMLKSIGVSGSIVGHSERREIGETSEMTNKKIKLLLNEKMTPILCIGEKLENHQIVKDVVESQIFSSLYGINNIKNIIFAYEPVWSIGSNKEVEFENIKKVSEIIYEFCNKNYNDNPNILYGGSVNKSNCEKIMKLKNINGVLVGRNSLNIESFERIING